MTPLVYLVTCAVNVTLVFGLAWIAAALLRRASASMRHAVWTAAVLCSLALPMLYIALPTRTTHPQTPLQVSSKPLNSTVDQLARLPITMVRAIPASPATWSWPRWILAAWGIGTAWCFTRMIAGLAALIALERRSRPLQSPQIRAVCSQGERAIRLLEAPGPNTMPATWGVIRPLVLLPSNYSVWPSEKLHAVVSHELAHVRRRDWLWSILAETARAIYWFHPLAWRAVREMRAESERSCDDAVLTAGAEPLPYAGVLLDLARGSIHHSRGWVMALAVARPTNLERRFTAMLNPNVNRSALSRRTAAFISSAALLVAGSLATLRSPAQELPGTISGQVFHEGAPVANAVVSAQIEGEAATRGMTVTDGAGAFELNGLTAGSYQLKVRRSGFDALVIPNVEVKNGETERRELTLEPASSNPQANSTRAPVRVEGTVTQANLIQASKVNPIYPASAKSARVQGKVLLKAVISLEGAPISLEVANPSVDPALARAAVEAVSHWRYNPSLLNGSPVEVMTEIAVNFTLSQ